MCAARQNAACLSLPTCAFPQTYMNPAHANGDGNVVTVGGGHGVDDGELYKDMAGTPVTSTPPSYAVIDEPGLAPSCAAINEPGRASQGAPHPTPCPVFRARMCTRPPWLVAARRRPGAHGACQELGTRTVPCLMCMPLHGWARAPCVFVGCGVLTAAACTALALFFSPPGAQR